MRLIFLKISFIVLKFYSSFMRTNTINAVHHGYKMSEQSCLSVNPNMFASLSRFAFTTTVCIFNMGALEA